MSFDSTVSNGKKYLLVSEIASELRVSSQHIRNLINRGDLAPAQKVGAAVRIPREALDAFIARTTVQAKAA